ncbi:Zinc finger protein [Quillaja saponaria]|uniref:Zinc finger protein n=1 Tax=Quillaja saponaria TaxID=32244 RepID=A0AAD7KX84_QUISA|nr:Zinc finger protein [Quillaja saponaria]
MQYIPIGRDNIEKDLAMKRGIDEIGEVDSRDDIANCLMLLSKVGETELSNNSKGGRIFRCKTCNRQFSSFQALGGHRASHKKPKLTGGDLLYDLPRKAKTHECPICGLEFSVGQALGGHMRRHRIRIRGGVAVNEGSVQRAMPVLKKPGANSKMVLCLDLNLTPLENDLNLNLRTTAVDCFI